MTNDNNNNTYSYAVEFTKTILVDAEDAVEAVEKAKQEEPQAQSFIYVDGNWYE